MIGTDTTFAAALQHPREAVDTALDALNTVDVPDTYYVMPLLDAQKALTRERLQRGN